MRKQPKTCVWVSAVEGKAFLQRSHADNVGHEPEFHGFEKVVPVFKQQHIQQHGGEKRGGNGKNHGVLLWRNKWRVDAQAAFGALWHLKSSLYFVSDRRAARGFMPTRFSGCLRGRNAWAASAPHLATI